MSRSPSTVPRSPRYQAIRGDELEHELSRSYDEIVDGAARIHPRAREQLVLDVAHDEPHAFVRFESPRGLQQTASRVAQLVHQHPQPPASPLPQPLSRSQSTRSSSPLASSPVAPKRPGLQSMRSMAQFRSQRQLSMASDKTNGSNPSTASHDNGSDHSHGHSHGHAHMRSLSRHGHGHGHGGSPAAMMNCPSSHYYIDSQGRLKVRRMWWFYTRLRRLMTHLLPGFKRDDNTFLCAPMITNTTLILTIYVLRLIINNALLSSLLTQGQQNECHEFSSELFDFFSFSLLGNAMLCIPAFNLSMCKLFKRVKPLSKLQLNKTPVNGALGIEPIGGMDATGAPVATAAAADGAVVHDDDHPKLKKTVLFTLCEVLVIIEIPYLVYVFLTTFIPLAAIADSRAQHSDLWTVSVRCASELPIGVFLAFLLAQAVGIIAYVLRYYQIILFHRMHEHFLYQRGCVPGRARFDYVEENFHVSWFASKHSKRVHEIKAKLYHAAKYGEIDEVRAQIEAATELDGPDFAHKWYENTGFMEGFFGKRFVKCQRNPLHVAVAFDNPEIVEELIGNGLFDIHQVEKMELLKLNVTWIYRFFFDIVPFLRMSNYSRHKTRLVFGPTGLFCSTLLTPLHVAVSMGNTDMVLLLLRYGADPNLSAESSHRKFMTPPLFWAINKECTRLLLDADANPVFVPGNGYFLTAFEVARLVGNHAVAMEIEKYGGDVALTPLHDASARGLKKEVRFYLEHGANPDTFGEKVTGFFRRTPLHWAAIRGEAKVVKLLLKFGANLNAKDAFGRTALTWACLLNRVKAVEILLKYGADVNVRDIQGDPLLCICAAGTCSSPSSEAFTSDAHHRGHDSHRRMTRTEHEAAGGGRNDNTPSQTAKTLDPEIFEMLQLHGIDIHATREANGDTALHVALRKNNEATAILLVRAGMSLTAVNYVGQRAMDCTTSSSLRYAIKKEAGHRDVMISYCHSHSALARKVRDALEAAYVTTWIDSMDPSGITGGSVWRQEIAQGIRSSALVLALLTTDYPVSQWCMKELAFAKMHNVPIVAIQCEEMQMTEELQVYLWTRQIVDFRPALVERVVEVMEGEEEERTKTTSSGHAGRDDMDDDEALLAAQDPRDAVEGEGAVAKPKLVVKHEYDDEIFHSCMRLLLDGIQDQIEEHRVKRAQRLQRQKMLLRARSTVQNDVPMSSDDEDDNDASDGDAGGLCGTAPRNLRANAGNRGDHDEASAVSPSSRDGGAFVFIAHGDYHLQFCQRLRNALQKHGVRCRVDQSVPSIQYGGGIPAGTTTSSASHNGSPRHFRRLQSNATNASAAGYGSGSEAATTTAQARQLAAKDAILECSAVIVVLSPISSKCDMLADQLAFAEDRGKLIVPLMLSLQTVDLAKRYTFSRSVVQHFNVSIGFEQSLDRLVVYLQQTAEAMQRQQQQKELEVQHQMRLARRQRRKERERRRRARENGGSSVAGSDDNADDDDDDALSSSPGSSPASSIRSAASRASVLRGVSPSSFSMMAPSLGADGTLPPTIPILQPSRQPTTGATSGHGWSVSTPTPSPPRDPSSAQFGRQSSIGSNHHDAGDGTPRLVRERHHFGTEPLLRRTSSMHSPLPPPRNDRQSGEL